MTLLCDDDMCQIATCLCQQGEDIGDSAKCVALEVLAVSQLYFSLFRELV
jgi:hypothetical protein